MASTDPRGFVHDPLYAQCSAPGITRKQDLSDLAGPPRTTRRWVSEIRRQVSEEFGFDIDVVMVHYIQTHSSPMLGAWFGDEGDEDSVYVAQVPSWARGGDYRYPEFAVPRIMEAVRQAHESLQPAVVGAGSAIDGRVAFNRRYVMRDGMVLINPPIADPQIRYAEDLPIQRLAWFVWSQRRCISSVRPSPHLPSD